jgi:polar amino acid transport system substrate-binding protein
MERYAVRFLALLGVLALGACSTLGLGSDSPALDRIRKSGELRVGMTGDYPPLSIIDRRDQTIGLEADLAQALAVTMGVKLSVVHLPFSELVAAVESGEVDMVMAGMTMTPERNMKVAFAGPYFISGKAILTRSETLARASGPSVLDRGSVKLVALAGTTSEGYAKNAIPNATLITTATYDEAVTMVIGGAVDAMVADYPICVVSVLRNPGAGLLTVVSPFTFEPIGIAVPADDMLFVNLVQNYLTSLEGTGLLDQLRHKWFDDPSWLLDLP